MAAGFSLMAASAGRLSRNFCSRSFAGAARRWTRPATLELDAVSSPAGANVALAAGDRRGRAVRRRQSRAAAGLCRMCGWPSPIWWAATHVKLRLAGGDGARLDAIAFRAAGTPLGEGLLAARGRAIHVAGRLRADEWNGQIRVQLEIEDAAAASA